MFSYHSIFRPYRVASNDRDKPNFIFSSDIPQKIRELAESFTTRQNEQGDVLDLGESLEFCINIELNMLLSRNKQLRPSDLIKDNLIYLANTRDRMPKVDSGVYGRGVSGQSLIRFACNEIFIASLVLRVLDFRINRTNNDIAIDFLKDENYGILVLCDHELLDQVENYIKNRFAHEIGSSSNVNIAPDDSSTNANSTTIISLNESEVMSESDNKSSMNTFIEEDDYNSSMEHLTLLKSNDTTRSTNDEDDETTRRNRLSNSEPRSEEPGFLKDVQNMRHNESQLENSILDNIGDVSSIDKVDIDALAAEEQVNQPRTFSESSETVTELTKDNLERRFSEASSSSATSKKRLQHKSSAASFSMINFEDTKDLEFAFKSKSETAPSYILQDKKFKFIKVGKVQKFVNLFEEKIGEEVTDSRPTTRASSPVRRGTPPIFK